LGHVFEARLDAVHLKFVCVKTSILELFPGNLEAEKMQRFMTAKFADVGGVDDQFEF
jgi:hypothetical protein